MDTENKPTTIEQNIMTPRYFGLNFNFTHHHFDILTKGEDLYEERHNYNNNRI